MPENQKVTRNYDKEIKEVFDNALKEIDSELMESIKLVSQMSTEESNQIQIVTTFSGTAQ